MDTLLTSTESHNRRIVHPTSYAMRHLSLNLDAATCIRGSMLVPLTAFPADRCARPAPRPGPYPEAAAWSDPETCIDGRQLLLSEYSVEIHHLGSSKYIDNITESTILVCLEGYWHRYPCLGRFEGVCGRPVVSKWLHERCTNPTV